MFNKKMRFKIGTKMLLALLGVSFASLILFAYIVFGGMKELGKSVLESSVILGEDAIEDSVTCLESQAESGLLNMARNQAALSDALLEKVETEVKIIAAFANYLWKDPSIHGNVRSYKQDEKPENIFEHSVYVLAPGVEEDAVRAEVDLSGNMDKAFIAISSNDANINTICMGTESGIFRSYPWRSGRAETYDPRQRYWYKKAMAEKGLVWTEPYVHASTKELIITCATPFYKVNNKIAGVAEIDVTLQVMYEDIISTQIGKEGYAFLLDKYGNLVVSPGLDPGDTRWDEVYTTKNLLGDENPALKDIIKNMINGKSGIGRTKFENEEKYIAYAPIRAASWSLGIVMPVKEVIAPAMSTQSKIISATRTVDCNINDHLRGTKKILLSVFFFIIGWILILARRLARRITQPIAALSRGVKIVGEGDLDYHLEVHTGDEVEDLANAFNGMTANLKKHIKRLTDTITSKERMEKELKIAHDIQMDLVPKIFPPFPDRKELDIYAVLQPAKEVGGDFYDYFFIDDNNLCFVIGDVSGKGVPAALFMTMIITLIRTIARDTKDPEEVITKVNKEICRDNRSSTFVTIFYGILNVTTGEVTFINAGHNPPILIGKNNETIPLRSSFGTIVGAFEDAVFKKEKTVLRKGDTLLLYTDGITEALSMKGDPFTEENLTKEILSQEGQSAKNSVEDILKRIRSFSGDSQQGDDITLLVLKYL
ncbi:MAG: SpoIIE family protein phosphatase [Candidatus Omnitrophota bacterium]